MSRRDLVHWRSSDDLRAKTADWDDLWRRGTARLPTARAGLLASWLDHFTPRARFDALAVVQDGRMVAAMPLVDQRVKRLLRLGGMTGNPWSPAGDLLLDACADDDALALLVDGLSQAPWPLLWFDTVDIDEPHWRRLLDAADFAGLRPMIQTRYAMARVDIAGSWNEISQAWSKSHRRSIRRIAAADNAAGGCTLRIIRPAPDQVEAALRRVFEVENRGWKAAAGTSTLQTPGMFDFYCEQARQLAATREAWILLLELGDRVVAYEYGWLSKRVYYSFKVGYDDEFAAMSPGQLLRLRFLEWCFQAREVDVVDFLGPATRSTAAWRSRQATLARVVLTPRRTSSRCASWLLGRRSQMRPWQEFRSENPAPSVVADEPATVLAGD